MKHDSPVDLSRIKELTNEGLAAFKEGKEMKAIRLYKKALKINPDFLIALNNLAAAYNKLEKFDLAAPIINKVNEIDPEYIHGIFNKGYWMYRAGRWQVSIDCLKKVLNKDSKYLDAYLILGQCYTDLGRYRKAIEIYSLGLKIAPNNESFLNNLGNIYKECREREKAISCFRKLIKINPKNSFVYISLAKLLIDEGQFDKAIPYLKKSIKIQRNNSYARILLGQAYYSLQKIHEGILSYKMAERFSRNDPEVITGLYRGYRDACDWAQAEKIEKSEVLKKYADPYSSLLAFDDPRADMEAAKRNALQFDIPKGDWYPVEKRQTKRQHKIRLGFISTDFRDHPVGHLIPGFFENYDKDKFTTYVYSVGEDDKSIYRKRVIDNCDYFYDLNGESDDSISDKIADDRIEILIDLMGHTYQARQKVLARHPANIQILYLGYPGTSGSSYTDYLIADKVVIPKNDYKYYTENIITLPDCFLICDSRMQVETNTFTRKQLGLPENKIILSCFSAPIKIDRRVFTIWMEILKKTENTVLLLRDANPLAVENQKSVAVANGVDPKRILYCKRIIKKEDHLSRLSLVDLGLDTLVYGGHTTTSDYLWAGVPVITKLGKHFAARVASSILINSGLAECVVKSDEEYIENVVGLVNNKRKLNELKNKLKKNISSAPFFNTSLFVKNFEMALKRVWTNYLLDKRESGEK